MSLAILRIASASHKTKHAVVAYALNRAPLPKMHLDLKRSCNLDLVVVISGKEIDDERLRYDEPVCNERERGTCNLDLVVVMSGKRDRR